MGTILKEVKGNNGILELEEDKIRIKRKGFIALLSHGAKGDKEIMIDHISSIQFKKVGITSGYIQFAFLGGTEAKGGLLQAGQDENTITFTKKQQPDFEAIKSMIEERMTKGKAPSESSSISDLEKLAELKEKGIISEEEFNAKKKQILGL